MKNIAYAGLLLCAATGIAVASVPDAPEFGMIGGGAGQILRVNVMAADSTLPAFVTVAFQDVLGRQVGEPGKVMRILPGQFESVEINFSRLGKGRSYVRPVVTYLEGSGKAYFLTEMYDQYLGRTGAGNFVPGSFGLAGSVRFGPIGLAYGQTMRMAIGAVVDPNERCAAIVGFRRSTGDIVDPNDRVSLSPGQWAFHEINGAKLMRYGQHESLLPAVQMDPGATGCVANVQVYDSASGWTNVYVPGSRALNF